MTKHHIEDDVHNQRNKDGEQNPPTDVAGFYLEHRLTVCGRVPVIA